LRNASIAGNRAWSHPSDGFGPERMVWFGEGGGGGDAKAEWGTSWRGVISGADRDRRAPLETKKGLQGNLTRGDIAKKK